MSRKCIAERAILRSLAVDGNQQNFSAALQAVCVMDGWMDGWMVEVRS